MARGVHEAKRLSCRVLLLSLHICISSGTFIGFSYDATQGIPNSCSPEEALSFLEKNKVVSSSQFRVYLSDPETFVDSLYNTNISAYYFLNPMQPKKLLDNNSSAISWLENNLLRHLPHLNISSIIIDGDKQELTSLLLTLNSIHSALQTLNLDRRVNVSPMFSLATFEKHLPGIARFVKQTKSFIYLETVVDSEFSLGDWFIHSVVERALFASYLLAPYPETPSVLNVKSPVAPSGVEIAGFTERLIHSLSSHNQLGSRISGILIEIPPLSKSEQEKLSWEEEVIFPKSHRELLGQKAATVHDTVAPITIPSTNPSPDIVTVPSTNPTNPITTTPITIPSAIPITTPITFPSTNPYTAPITVPAMNPVNPPVVTNSTTAPVTVPPVTNPVYTPMNPANQPATNPVTTYPSPPSTVPVSPTTGSGQSWCVARSNAPEDALQKALDYACGIGGADCSAIQVSGSCYSPNSLQAHTSYAINSYYQRNRLPTSCDFGGTAMLVTVDPSTGACAYSSSSSNTGNVSTGIGTGPYGNTTPAYGSSTSGSSGSSVLNANSSDGSSTVFGSDSSTGTIRRGSFCRPGVWILLSVVSSAVLHQ